MRDVAFLETLVELLESSHTINRGKALVCLYLCVTQNPRSLVEVTSTSKFSHAMDKLARENFKYVQQCY